MIAPHTHTHTHRTESGEELKKTHFFRCGTSSILKNSQFRNEFLKKQLEDAHQKKAMREDVDHQTAAKARRWLITETRVGTTAA